MQDAKAAAGAWLKQQVGLARRHAIPTIAIGLFTILIAAAQAWCFAAILATALAARPPGVSYLVGFAVLALARAPLAVLADRSAFDSGAAARRRLRSDALDRLLSAGPRMLREQHSAELAATVVDRVEVLDGLFARWAPAATLAVAGPVLVGLIAGIADPVAALVLLGAGLLVP